MKFGNTTQCGFGILAAVLLTTAAGCNEHKYTTQDVIAELQVAAVASDTHTTREEAAPQLNPRLLRRFKSVSTNVTAHGADDQALVDLGRMLYFENRLSKSGTISCNSCHKLDNYGVDGERTSLGHDGKRGTRNSPTVYHAGGYFAQFWDGRAATLEEQAVGPIVNPVEMGMAGARDVEHALRSIPEYRAHFAAAFPQQGEPVTYANVGKAIGAFEQRLVTRSRWDDFLDGNKSALTAKEMQGLRVFTNVGCMVCHTGELLGGSMFAKVGVVEEWNNQTDQGRYEVTHNETDRMMFKVPTLRNVAKTAPYFHDASASTLEQAVDMMGRHQLGLELTQSEREAIVAWLSALTGDMPKDYIAPPKLPASSRG